MREVTLFCEDSFHEKFIGALLLRFGHEYGVGVRPTFLSAQGGLSRMHTEFRLFLRDLARERQPYPDSVIVVVDANCQGHNGRQALMDNELHHFPQFQQLVSYAIPDPHIERWMLVDPDAFQGVFGRGCTLPKIKCAKNEYKKLLRDEIRACEIEPPLGGEEFAEDIVRGMNLGKVETSEQSFGLFLKSLKSQFNRWAIR